MRLTQEGRHDANNQKDQQQGRKETDTDCQADCADQVLDEATHHLHQHDPIGALRTRALHLVVKQRILVTGQIQARGVFHNARTDVPREFVGEHGVKIAEHASQHRRHAREHKLQGYQPPECVGQRGVIPDVTIDCVDDDLGDPQQRDGNHRDDHARGTA